MVLLQSKECKASSRVKLLTLDSLLSLHIQRLEQGGMGESEEEVSTAPMIFVSVDPDTNRPLYHLVMPAPPIKNLSLRGGGGKGQGYVKMIEVFRRNGIFDHLENVSGSSAGGIAAVALAFGIKDVDNFCSEVQAGVMPGSSQAAFKAMPFLKDKFHGIGVLGSAAGIIPIIDRITAQKVQEFLKNETVRTFVIKNTSDEEYGRLETLRTRTLETKNERDLITFSDLSLLKSIADQVRGQEPSFEMQNNFLNLILTGWSGSETKMIYFSAEEHPNMPIVYAVRVTMSLPGVFLHVRLELDGKIHELYDGCVGSSSPSEVFILLLPSNASEREKITYQRTQGETLTCIFDANGSGSKAESSRYTYGMSKGKRRIMKLVGAIRNIDQVTDLRADENRKHDILGNVCIVPHGNIDTFNMNPSPEQKAMADAMSELAAENWCFAHRGEFIELTSFSLELLLQELTEEQRQQIDRKIWHRVLQSELSTREDALSSVATDLFTRKIAPEDLEIQLDDLETSASRNLTEEQEELLNRTNLRYLWAVLPHRARRMLCRKLKRHFNLRVHRDINPSKQKSITPLNVTDDKINATEYVPRETLLRAF